MEHSAVKIGMEMAEGEITFEENNDLFRWGSTSRCYLIRSGGFPAGNFFIGLSGKRLYSFLATGVYFDEPGTLREFLGPYLDRYRTYSP